jgi:WhiB family redox-sensing transcriptional regulator
VTTDPNAWLAYVAREPDAWRASAACKGMDADLFFPERGEDTAAGLLVCAGCPSRVPCLEAHIEEASGIFGGTTGRQREKIRRRMHRTTRCRQCGAEFVRHGTASYCSAECTRAGKREREVARRAGTTRGAA